MRILAAIYLGIVLVNFFLWLGNGVHEGSALTPHTLLIWVLYAFSVLALLAFVLGRRLLPRWLWQGVFFTYVATRALELVLAGQVLTGETFVANLNIVASYLWLVVPAGLAMWYLGFLTPASLRALEPLAPNYRRLSEQLLP